jgi:sugar transferase (PEP-CTERM system associated)
MNTTVIGSYEQLLEIVERERIDKIVVALPDRRGRLPIEPLLKCKLQGIEVEEGTTFYEQISGKIMLENLRASWMVFSHGFAVSPLLRLLKRLGDLLFASLGLVVAVPLMTVIAVLIKLDSPGPALFTQERVGQNGKLFVLFKFRSMRPDAEAATGPIFAETDDLRITRVGWFIRRTRFDELPQLWNVLKGDMSFVGPRPERPFFVDKFAKEIPYYVQRLSVKPGITGWAQVNYPYAASTEDALEKLQLDLFYVKNTSFFLDLFILLKTVKITLIGEGAR